MSVTRLLLTVPVTSLVERPPLFPDLGLGYLASAVLKAGHKVSIRSWNMNPSVSDFVNYIKQNSFDVIGIKVFTKDISAANKTIEIIREVSPRTTVVVGGPHPSTSSPTEVVLDIPKADFIFRGEARQCIILALNSIRLIIS